MSLLSTTTGAKTTTTTWSYQLQYNFKFKKSLFLLLRTPLPTSCGCRCRRGVAVRCVAQGEPAKSGSDSGNNNDDNNNNNNWFGLGNDNLDWSGANSAHSNNHNQGIAGVVGVGLASFLVVAGITSAALSIGKRSTSRPKPEMEPLTHHQQELLFTSPEEIHVQEANANDDHHSALQATNLETNTDLQDQQLDLYDDDGLHVSSVDSLTTIEQQADALHNTIDSPSITAFDDNSQAFASNTDPNIETELVTSSEIEMAPAVLTKEDHFSDKGTDTLIGDTYFKENGVLDAEISAAPSSAESQDAIGNQSVSETLSPDDSVTSRGIPAPSLLSAALQVPPGKVLVPAVTDQTQAQALSALQVLKVVEIDAQAGDLCTRREYARWLVSASSVLSRNLILKVYPAMYIENATELAFDDITPEDPDFTSIQGLAEAGLIASKLSRRDMQSSPDEDIGSFYFHPDSPLSRQDLVTWKMALEKRQLPEANRKDLHQLSGFIDIDRIDPDAVPALVADISAGDQGILALAFGYTRLFQPDKPVTKGQAAIALATGEAAEIVSEELARIEAESMADKAVTAHNALVAEVEKEINANFEKELLMERGKIDVVQKMAEEATLEVERLRAERQVQNNALMKERAAVESEMEVLSRLRHELEEQLQGLMSNRVEISYEKEMIEKLRKETEKENQAITRLQYELEVERKALTMARSWAEDEARRVQEHAKALEEARDRWERKGIKVVVDEDLRDNAIADVTWSNVRKKLALEETVERAETLTGKLNLMASEVKGKSKEIINKIITKIRALISAIKQWISKVGAQITEFQDVAFVKTGESVQELQVHAAGLGTTVKEGAKRVIDDCRDGVGKLTQRFKT